VRPGRLIATAVDTTTAATPTAIPAYVDRLVAAPPGQIWFADGSNDLWGLPETATVTTRFVPEQSRLEQLRSSLIP
jgi:hypothetical protein